MEYGEDIAEHEPFTQTFDVRTISWNATYSGGDTFANTEEGCIKTSSSTPMALYGTPFEVEY